MIRLVKRSFMVGVLLVGSALLHGMNPGLVPTIVQPTGPSVQHQTALPSNDAIKKGDKIRKFYEEVKPKNYYNHSADPYKELLRKDPWLLHECEPITGRTLEMYVAQQWLSSFTGRTPGYIKIAPHVYTWIGDNPPSRYRMREIFQHVLKIGKSDRRFINRLDELKSFLKNKERLCEDLIADFKESFPHEDLSVVSQLAPSSASYGQSSSQVDAVSLAHAEAALDDLPEDHTIVLNLNETQKVNLVLDLFEAAASGDIDRVKQLIREYSWLVKAEKAGSPILYFVADKARSNYNWKQRGEAYYSKQDKRQHENQEQIFALLLLNGADLDALVSSETWSTWGWEGYRRVEKRKIPTIEEALKQYVSSDYQDLWSIISDYKKDPQLLWQRFPNLAKQSDDWDWDDDDDEWGTAASSNLGATSGVASAAASPVGAVSAGNSVSTHEEPASSNFWTSWKGIGLGVGTLATVGGLAWWLKNRAAQSADDDLDDDDSDDSYNE